MTIIVKEQDILKKDAPNGGAWTEDNIRSYQESHGINYGGAVFVRGDKPNREWSNHRHFGLTPQQVNTPAPVAEDETAKLKAEIQALKDQLAEQGTVTHTGVERHGLDKRSKEYRDSRKQA